MRVFLAGLLLGASACTVEAPQPSEGSVLRIAGSRAFANHLAPDLVDQFKRSNADVGVAVDGGGSAAGFKALLRGEADMAASSRPPTAAEAEQASAYGFDLAASGSIVAVNVVAVATHPGSMIDSLTYDQVIGIFCTGEINDWSALGLDDAPIHALTVDPTHGERVLFEDFFCGPKGIGAHVQTASWAQIGQALIDDTHSISYGSMGNRGGKLVALRPDAMAKPMSPTRQNIIRGAYPLAHDLMLYTHGDAEGPTADFLAFIDSPAGQDLVDQAHFVPLFYRPERMDDSRPLRETIHFEPGSSTPTQRSVARLGLLSRELAERAGEYNHIILEGFTDTSEDDAEGLSTARAEKVRDMLVDAIPGLFVEIIPRGSMNPLAPNETPYGRQRNRRVQVYLADEEAPEPPMDEIPAPE